MGRAMLAVFMSGLVTAACASPPVAAQVGERVLIRNGFVVPPGGLGSDHDRAVAARSTDRALALLYLPSSREITVDLGRLAGPQVAARWYDPADGRFSAVGGSPFSAAGARRFNPEPHNSSGFHDWVLVLESHT